MNDLTDTSAEIALVEESPDNSTATLLRTASEKFRECKALRVINDTVQPIAHELWFVIKEDRMAHEGCIQCDEGERNADVLTACSPKIETLRIVFRTGMHNTFVTYFINEDEWIREVHHAADGSLYSDVSEVELQAMLQCMQDAEFFTPEVRS